MTFDELYFSVKKKIQENSGIVLDNKLFAVTLGDIYGNAFYVLWKDGKFSVEPYLYHDYNVCITAPQNSLELLFTERQHLFAAYMNKEMKIKGSFEDVMAFHQLLSYFTKEKYYTDYYRTLWYWYCRSEYGPSLSLAKEISDILRASWDFYVETFDKAGGYKIGGAVWTKDYHTSWLVGFHDYIYFL